MIRTIAKKALAALLRLEAELVLDKYKPKIVAVAGSVGKTSTKDALVTILAAEHFVWGSQKSYNSEFGVPLTILGCKSGGKNPLLWLKNILEGVALMIFDNPYPEWLVLEVGADRPGDIGAITKWLKLDAVILTHFPPVPVHVEFFSSPLALHQEDFSLVEAVKAGGLVVINGDDEIMMSLVNDNLRHKCQVIAYGFNEGVEVRASNEKIVYSEEGTRWPTGLTFKVDVKGGSYPVGLTGFLGRHQIYPPLAALAFGTGQDFNVVTMIEALRHHAGPPGRLRLIAGEKDTLILDDTYNSSPAALAAALKTLGEIEGEHRKIAIIGDMLELGAHTIEAHKEAGRQAAEVCDDIFFVGLRAKFAADGAKETRLPARQEKFSARKIHFYHDAAAVAKALEKMLAPGDIALIKGSQGMRLEKVVEEVMAEPEKKAALLCRQDREWVGR